MAAASYTTDLTLISDGSEGTGSWSARGGGASGLNQETDYYIQGSNCISKNAWASATKGMIHDDGAGITVSADDHVLFWITHLTPNSLANIAAGGLQALIGSSSSAYRHFYVGGADTLPFGGWVLGAVGFTSSTATTTADNTTGSPSTTFRYFGGLANLPSGGPTKGAPFAIDGIRYGRCEARCTAGDLSNGYATFAGAQAALDSTTNLYGLISFNGGAYFQSGLFLFGLAATAVDFRDSNKTIFIRDHPGATANFNTFEVRHSSSNVELENIVFKALGTQSPGRWVTTDNAVVVLTGCSFTDMGVFGFGTNTVVDTCGFNGCDQITHGGADMSGSAIAGYEGTANTSAMIYNVNADPDGEMDNMSFAKGSAATHAIEFGTSSPLSMTLRGCDFNGYNASNSNNDSTFHFKRTGGTVTLSLVGCTGNVSYRSDGATISIVQDPVTVTVVSTTTTGTAISGARVLLEAADGTGPLPYQDSVTITRSGTTASVSHTAHGLAAGKKVRIEGSNQWQYNGVFAISNVTVNAYDYTIASDPGTDATGTITATGVVLEGTTDGSGEISDSRTYSSAQPVTGWSRKSSGSPYYKPGSITGEVSATAGLTATAVMALDE